ncbi:hybrid sensor histidine kinase/response regulator [Haloglomus litoreum]|uniref:ATP-binding response regulator n=1 Tax=Haloglomus litoreum TaxID=3034026 RepID=UPI0023E8379E|nr:ATP-binding protein [Haloglomus sp. DT116]
MTDDTPRVLYVDDGPAMRELVSRGFERRPGVTSWAALDGAMALAAVEATRFDCVVASHDLPEMSGLDLLDEIRATHTELPFVLFAADGDEQLAAEALGRGATDYLRRSGANPVPLVVDRATDYATEHFERAALERVRERYEIVGRTVSDVVWEWDLETGAVRWGAGVEAALGFDRSGSYDRSWWLERVHPEDREALRAACRPVREGDEQGFECRYRLRRADGSYAHVVDAGEGVGDGEPGRLVGALRDETERIERAAALERRNEQLDQFATVVSHDLRNPLGVVRGRIQLARETGDLDHLADAVDATDRMGELIDDLLALAREGRTVEEPEPVALGPIARTAWASIPDREAVDATLEVETDVGERLLADPDRLRQLLENLFANAVEHGSRGVDSEGRQDADGPALTVRIGWLPDGDGFYVADDGPGIPPDRRDEVFDLGDTDGGTGVGLAIVEEVATAHGWELEVVESDEGGARFEVRGVTPGGEDGADGAAS